jgi:hypothetical protein
MKDLTDQLAEGVERRGFLARMSKAAFVAAAGAGALFGAAGRAEAKTGCCDRAFTRTCGTGDRRTCSQSYVWNCCGGGLSCSCYECYSTKCTWVTCTAATC